VRQERVEAIRSKSFAKGAPDLAVEIFSPSDHVRQLMRKVKQYFAAGCHTVWIVYPDRQEVQILEASGTDRLLQRLGHDRSPGTIAGILGSSGEILRIARQAG
jgi:Uma2 family endonuclease